MKYVVIAPVYGKKEFVIKALFEFEMKEAVLIHNKEHKLLAEEVARELKSKGIPSSVKEIGNNYWEDVFHIVNQVTKVAGSKNIIVNVSTTNEGCKYVLVSAAFVNGLKAVDINEKGEFIMLPIMKFSYYKLLSPKKMELLKLLYGSNCCDSMDELGKRTKMSLPLVSYHVNGNLKSEGLIELGLINTSVVGGKTKISLSLLGKLLVQGLIDQVEE